MASLPAFTPEQVENVKRRLTARVAYMNGRKLEEGDWSYVYCKARNLEVGNWSNLKADVEVPGLSLEHKMLKRPDKAALKSWCGKSLMHPALTRQVTLPNIPDANEAMQNVIAQYQVVLNQRRASVSALSNGKPCELRSGWLLYRQDLSEFMYFEERMQNLDPEKHYAEWTYEEADGDELVDTVEKAKSTRRKNRNLWVKEKGTDIKRWSVTGAGSGTKIQPYFVVPDSKDPNLYYFRVQGESKGNGTKSVWLTESTAEKLEKVLGGLEPHTLDEVIRSTPSIEKTATNKTTEPVREIAVPDAAYEILHHKFKGNGDDDRFLSLLEAALVVKLEKEKALPLKEG